MSLYPAEKLNFGLSAGAVAASFAVASPLFAGSLALGAALETMNFRFMHRTADAVFTGVVPSGGGWVAILVLRLGLMFAGIVAAMLNGADPFGLVIGLSLVMPATVAAAIWHRPAMVCQEPLPALDPEDPIWDDYSVWRPGRMNSTRDEETE
jgi:hypothetical protein